MAPAHPHATSVAVYPALFHRHCRRHGNSQIESQTDNDNNNNNISLIDLSNENNYNSASDAVADPAAAAAAISADAAAAVADFSWWGGNLILKLDQNVTNKVDNMTTLRSILQIANSI